MSKLLYNTNEWSLELIDKMWEVIDDIATNKYGLTYHDPQIEIVTADQMLYHHSMNAMPTLYNHWSFGKRFEESIKGWEAGMSSIAYETIINTDPMVCYIMEDNSATMQALVLAHAICGHGSFFKHNYLFKEWTDPKAVINTLRYSKSYIAECEQKYGAVRVERLIDACHSLFYNSIDKYKRRRFERPSDAYEKAVNRAKSEEENFDIVMDTLKKPQATRKKGTIKAYRAFEWPWPEENLLYFIEKNSPMLEDWEKEIVRIVRKSAQYFYPQIQTKMMNEGWASFWHHTLMTDLYDEGYIDEGNYLEFLDSHTAVCCQRDQQQMNPYAIGFELFTDLRRACEDPTEDDYKYLPMVAGKPWLETLKWTMENFKDETFVTEFLGPNVVDHFELFCYEDDTSSKNYKILTIQDKEDIYELRKQLASNYTFAELLPQVEIVGFDHKTDRTLHMRCTHKDGKVLDKESLKSVTKYVHKLWGYPILVDEYDSEGEHIDTHRRLHR